MDRLQDQDRPAASLAPLLHESRVGWDVLEDRYGALLRLVDTVLGVVPNCDPLSGDLAAGVPHLQHPGAEPPEPAGPDPRAGWTASRRRRPGHVRGQPHGRLPVLLGAQLLVRHAARRLPREGGGGVGSGPDVVHPWRARGDRSGSVVGAHSLRAHRRRAGGAGRRLRRAQRRVGRARRRHDGVPQQVHGLDRRRARAVRRQRGVVDDGARLVTGQGGHAARPRGPRAASPRLSTGCGPGCDCSRCCLPPSGSTVVGSAGRPAGGRTSPPSCPSGRATTSRCWRGCTRAAPAAAWPRCSSRISIRRPPSWASISRCWSERSSPRSWATSAWPTTSLRWPVTPASTARGSETPSRTPEATTRRRPPAPHRVGVTGAGPRCVLQPRPNRRLHRGGLPGERPVAGGGRRDHHLVVRAADAAPPHLLRDGRRLRIAYGDVEVHHLLLAVGVGPDRARKALSRRPLAACRHRYPARSSASGGRVGNEGVTRGGKRLVAAVGVEGAHRAGGDGVAGDGAPTVIRDAGAGRLVRGRGRRRHHPCPRAPVSGQRLPG